MYAPNATPNPASGPLRLTPPATAKMIAMFSADVVVPATQVRTVNGLKRYSTDSCSGLSQGASAKHRMRQKVVMDSCRGAGYMQETV